MVTVVGFDCLVISTQAGLCTRSKIVVKFMSVSHTQTCACTHTHTHFTYERMMSLFSKTFDQFLHNMVSRHRFVLASLTSSGRCWFFFFLPWNNSQLGPRPSHCLGFMITTIRHTIIVRTPLDKWPAWCRDLYLTTHNRQPSMPLVGFKPTIPASERLQTHPLDHAATGISRCWG